LDFGSWFLSFGPFNFLLLRFERKYRIEGMGLAALKQIIRMHPASFRTLYPDRQINNIYFDTPELFTWHQNVWGHGTRKKYRVRWYGPDPHIAEHPRFEIKSKMNELGSKEVEKIAPFTLDDLRDLNRWVNARPGLAIRLQPVLLNAYYRSYFATPDRKFRLTVDFALRYHSLLAHPVFHGYAIQDSHVLIMEIKYDEKYDIEADRVTQHFAFRQSKHSKYVNGVYFTV
jgi:hypothetical protein